MIEEASLNAWPAMQQMVYDGWVLRFSRGYTKRANSVNPIYPSEIDIETKVNTCEDIYARLGLPAIFRIPSISPAVGLDQTLESRGYQQIDRTRVMVLDLAEQEYKVEPGLELREDTLKVWLDIFSEFHHSTPEQRRQHAKLLQAIPTKAVFATLRRDGKPLASGLGVLAERYIGLFDLITAPDERRRGYGTNLLNGILQWAQAHTMDQAYLQVMESNRPAHELYKKEGFAELYHYWYRVPR